MGISDPATPEENFHKGVKELEGFMSPEQVRIMHTIRARQMLRSEDTLNIDNFGTDVIDGLSPRLVTGELGLVQPSAAPIAQPDVLALMSGEEKATNGHTNGDATHTNGDATHTNGVAAHTNGTNGTNGTSSHESETAATHLMPLKGHTQTTNEATRLKTQDDLHNIAEEMETPHDTMLRLFNSVSPQVSNQLLR